MNDNINQLSQNNKNIPKILKNDDDNHNKVIDNNCKNDIYKVCETNPVSNDRVIQGILPFLFTLGMIPMNFSQDPYVYSDKVFHPLSFFYNQMNVGFSKNKSYLESPSPTYIDYNEISIIPNLSKNQLLHGMTIDNKLGLILIDANISNKFKGLVGNMMYSFFSSSFNKKSISLPVKVFEPKSTLQSITEFMSFGPVFLINASKETNSIEKLKNVICYAVSGLYTCSKKLKPFKPLLGETFEALFNDNTSIYCEQISHYPSIIRFYVRDITNLYTVSGYYELNSKSKSMGNNLVVYHKGPNIIDFQGKYKVIYNMPKIKLLNCLSDSKRSSIWKSIIVFADVKSNLKAIIRFGKNKNMINNFEGFIIHFNYPHNYKFNIDEEIKQAKQLFKEAKNLKILCEINGNWLENLKFDNRIYWNIDKYMPSWICPSQKILPSDGRFREDIIWLFRSFSTSIEIEKKKYEDYSQKWKNLIETIQRNDRELRKKKKEKDKKDYA